MNSVNHNFVLFLILLNTPFTNGNQAEISVSSNTIQIHHVLHDLKNCDVQIFHDGINAENFEPDATYLSPTTIFDRIMRDYRTHATNVSRTRISRFRLSILFASFLMADPDKANKSGRLLFWSEMANYLYFDEDRRHWVLFTRNVYILVLSKRDVLQEEEDALFVNLVDNFAIAWQRDGGKFNFCVHESSTPPSLQRFKCKLMDRSVPEMFKDLSRPPEIWGISDDTASRQVSYDGSDIVIHTLENPFVRGEEFLDITNYIIYTVLKRENVSRMTFKLNNFYAQVEYVKYEWWRWGKHHRQFVTTSFAGFQFLSCYQENFMTFTFYITPFKSEVWISLIVSIAALIIALVIFIKLSARQEGRPTSFSPLLFILASIFEEDYPVPGQIERTNYFRCSIGAWIVMTVVLTNCYNGLMITELNSHQATNFLESFHSNVICGPDPVSNFENSQKSNITVSEWLVSNSYQTFLEHWDWENLDKLYDSHDSYLKLWYNYEKCVSLLSSATDYLHSWIWETNLPKSDLWYFLRWALVRSDIAKLKDLLRHVSATHLSQEAKFLSQESLIILGLMNPAHPHEPSELVVEDGEVNLQKSVELQVIKCGRTVFVAQSFNLDAEMYFLTRKYYWIKFYKGRDQLDNSPYGWVIKGGSKSRVTENLRAQFETGIHQRLREEEFGRKYVGRKPVEERIIVEDDHGMNIKSGIGTLFIIVGGILGIGLVVFFVEIYSLVRNILINWLMADLFCKSAIFCV